jgi:hypothetical protein
MVAGTMPIAGSSTAAGRQQSQRAELIVFGEVAGEQLGRRVKLMVISPGCNATAIPAFDNEWL